MAEIAPLIVCSAAQPVSQSSFGVRLDHWGGEAWRPGSSCNIGFRRCSHPGVLLLLCPSMRCGSRCCCRGCGPRCWRVPS